MFGDFLKKLFGSANDRKIKPYHARVAAINALEEEYQKLSDGELAGLTEKFRARLAEGETLDDLLPEAFAAVRETSVRVLGMRHYDVQLIGGMVLHEGKIAEMRTGEGKTLVSTLPTYLNGLTGEGVHVITVNDYLASRDAEWMGRIHKFLGLTVGCILHDMKNEERKEQYACDITYGTNNEFGFDYLRDNLKISIDRLAQRGHHYAIVDEVDSILIDEARTPLIISGQVDKDEHSYAEFKDPVERLIRAQKKRIESLLAQALSHPESGDGSEERYFKLCQAQRGDPKNKKLFSLVTGDKDTKKLMDKLEGQLKINKEVHLLNEGLLFAYSSSENAVELTDEGQEMLTQIIGDVFIIPDLYEAEEAIDKDDSLDADAKGEARKEVLRNYEQANTKLHNIHQLLKAYTVQEKDVDYVVKDGQVVIVDEFTGRLMPGRRWSDGLHQAVEAREGVTIRKASQTVATITLQNYFRMYDKLSGMTGTAETEAPEFMNIYKLDVVVVPTNKPMIRDDRPDVVYLNEKDKYGAILKEILDAHQRGQPILVGTTSVEKSEKLAKHLKKRNVKHEVLNAKNHDREASIVSQAGRKGAVMISTNMAGRGTDIVLGGNPEMMLKTTVTEEMAQEEVDRLTEKIETQCAEEQKHVLEAGGLYVLGTERHESRRIDNQLRGRSGRQGDPGTTRFFLSLEDDLMRRFGSERIGAIMSKMGWDKPEEGEEELVIESRMVTRSIQNAQKKVEENNFDIRKNLLEYDDVNNKQREIIYGIRNRILRGDDLKEYLFETVEALCADLSAAFAPESKAGPDDAEHWTRLERELAQCGLFHSVSHDENPQKNEDLKSYLLSLFHSDYDKKNEQIQKWTDGESDFGDAVVRRVLLEVLDKHWMEVLYTLDQIRDSVGLRSYGQKDPKLEYKKAAYEAFEDMMSQVGEEWLEKVFAIRLTSPEEAEAQRRGARRVAGKLNERLSRAANQGAMAAERRLATNTSENAKQKTVKRDQPKVGRNDPCPCGSGKKYKKCCGRAESADVSP